MNINQTKLTDAIMAQAAALSHGIMQALNSTAEHGRGSSATLSLKIAHDKKDPSAITVVVQSKIKQPINSHRDATSWSDKEEILRYDVGEAQGQARIEVEQ